MQIDDDQDEDIMSVLLDPLPLNDMFFFNTGVPPGNVFEVTSDSKLFTVIRRVKWKNVPAVRLNQLFADIFHELQALIAYKALNYIPCGIGGLSSLITIPQEESSKEDHIEVVLTGDIIKLKKKEDKYMFTHHAQNSGVSEFSEGPVPCLLPRTCQQEDEKCGYENMEAKKQSPDGMFEFVHLTTMSTFPEAVSIKYLGRLHLHLIKEVSSPRHKEELADFGQIFLNEVQTIARAHVKSRRGNALLKYTLTEFSISDDDKHVYGIIGISGDAVFVK
eukprot:TRINITY_DN6125_c0_g1_i1.p1 TRINITY_DN6125_c0_g1~~TRINITY_DN6125_c0_g1_i1.p1  ORF type:complete len:276 (+),score=57.10 TRINITY_DN6125_c0_g1_i1:83-910(+)